MTIRGSILVGLAMLAAGCGTTAMPAPPRKPSTPAGIAYELYTHCGIEWARIDHTFWRARHQLSDGNGNPPRGWGNPFQAGTLTMLSRTTAKFASAAGTVTFQRTARTRPPVVCS
jgi:hypothetical protein